jgi:hypothetical protein
MSDHPLLAAARTLLIRANDDPEGWLSSEDAAAALGMGSDAWGKLRRSLFKSGKLEARSIKRMASDGKMRPIPVYRVKPASGRPVGHGDARVRRVRRVRTRTGKTLPRKA